MSIDEAFEMTAFARSAVSACALLCIGAAAIATTHSAPPAKTLDGGVLARVVVTATALPR